MNWTLLRHRMLHAVSVGRVQRRRRGGHDLSIRSSCSTPAQMSRAVNTLWDAGAVRESVLDGSKLVIITQAGELLLTRWNIEHGQVTE